MNCAETKQATTRRLDSLSDARPYSARTPRMHVYIISLGSGSVSFCFVTSLSSARWPKSRAMVEGERKGPLSGGMSLFDALRSTCLASPHVTSPVPLLSPSALPIAPLFKRTGSPLSQSPCFRLYIDNTINISYYSIKSVS